MYGIRVIHGRYDTVWRTSLHANVTKKNKPTIPDMWNVGSSLGQASVPPRFQSEATIAILNGE